MILADLARRIFCQELAQRTTIMELAWTGIVAISFGVTAFNLRDAVMDRRWLQIRRTNSIAALVATGNVRAESLRTAAQGLLLLAGLLAVFTHDPQTDICGYTGPGAGIAILFVLFAVLLLANSMLERRTRKRVLKMVGALRPHEGR